jgi:hypothetical protein
MTDVAAQRENLERQWQKQSEVGQARQQSNARQRVALAGPDWYSPGDGIGHVLVAQLDLPQATNGLALLHEDRSEDISF